MPADARLYDPRSDADYLRAVDAAAAPADQRQRFRLLSIEEVKAIPAPKFLVDDLLPEGALAEMHGPPGGGKTFIALDVALSIASGLPWFGRRVRRGAVVYVIGEGKAGMGARIRAWEAKAAVTRGVRFHVVDEPVQLLEPRDLGLFVRALVPLGEPPALIVLDTLARCFVGGEENSARDMGMAIAGADQIRRVTGAAVLIVHHTRKEGDQERGSVALRGGVDTMMAVKEEDDHLVVTCEKQKDAAPFAPIPLQLRPSADSMAVYAPALVSGPSRKAMALLESLVRDFPGGSASATEWKEASPGSPATFYRQRGELLRAGYVAEEAKGPGKRFRATPEGKIALARLAADARDRAASENSHGVLTEILTAPGGSGGGGVGGGEGTSPPPPRRATTPGILENSHSAPENSHGLTENSHSHGENENPDPRDLYEEIEERLGIQQEGTFRESSEAN
jgi:hypothetical protein